MPRQMGKKREMEVYFYLMNGFKISEDTIYIGWSYCHWKNISPTCHKYTSDLLQFTSSYKHHELNIASLTYNSLKNVHDVG